MRNDCFNRLQATSESGFRIEPPDTELDYEAQIRARFSELQRVLDEERGSLAQTICQAAFTFVTNDLSKEHWEIVDKVRKEYWGEEKPTSTFVETKRRPDNRPWQKSAIALRPVVWYNPLSVTDYHIEGNQFLPSAYCHAKKVETDDSFELYISGMCGVAGDPDNPKNPSGIRIIDPSIIGQTHSALMYCQKLIKQAEFSNEDIHAVDIFYDTRHQPGYIVQQANYFYPIARINAIPVTALFMAGLYVEIRPRGTKWK